VETCKFCTLFDFAKDKAKPLAVIMDKPGQSLPVSVIHAPDRSTVIVICEQRYGTWGTVPCHKSITARLRCIYL
jgi:hypothetical protein